MAGASTRETLQPPDPSGQRLKAVNLGPSLLEISVFDDEFPHVVRDVTYLPGNLSPYVVVPHHVHRRIIWRTLYGVDLSGLPQVRVEVKGMDDTRDRLLHRIPEAAWRLGLSRSTLYELIAAQEIRVIRVGRAVRIPAIELEAWVARQTAGGDSPAA